MEETITDVIKGEWVHFRGGNFHFHFAPSLLGVSSEKKEFASLGINSTRVDPFWKSPIFRKRKRKSQKLFPVVKIAENMGVYPYTFVIQVFMKQMKVSFCIVAKGAMGFKAPLYLGHSI